MISTGVVCDDDMMGTRNGFAIKPHTVLVRVSSSHANHVASFIESIIKVARVLYSNSSRLLLGYSFTVDTYIHLLFTLDSSNVVIPFTGIEWSTPV